MSSKEYLKRRQQIRQRARRRRQIIAAVVYAVLAFVVFVGVFFAGSISRAEGQKSFVTCADCPDVEILEVDRYA